MRHLTQIHFKEVSCYDQISQDHQACQSESQSNRRMSDYTHIRKELLRNGVNKKLLWAEYLEECRLSGDGPLMMYSQFCYYIQQNDQKGRATMHINRKPAEQVEVDWAGDPAHIIDPDTGEILEAQIFVGVMTYSQYPYVEASMDKKLPSWTAAYVHMYECFDGIAKFLVSDNCRTANHRSHLTSVCMAVKGSTYSTLTEHMPESRQQYLEWNGDRFRK